MSKRVCHSKEVENNTNELCPLLMETAAVLVIWQTYRRWKEQL